VAAALTDRRDQDLWDASLVREAADQEWIEKRVQRMRRDARRRLS
jgi:hypothetical protein